MRTKHMCTRKNLVLEAVVEKKIEIEYMHMSSMKADSLTKPLEGLNFDSFMKSIFGCLNQLHALGYEIKCYK